LEVEQAGDTVEGVKVYPSVVAATAGDAVAKTPIPTARAVLPTPATRMYCS
jgi:hypothetical protein